MNPQHTKVTLVAVLCLALLTESRAVNADQTKDGNPSETVNAATSSSANVRPISEDAQRFLPLEGGWNTRTFKGLHGTYGEIPATSFIRTADLSKLTDADRDALAAAGVTLDIDLRTAEEEERSPDLLAQDKRFAYERISLLGTEKMDLEEMTQNMPDSLGEGYALWLGQNQQQFKHVFQRIAAERGGTVLFHCTAGKDRTGMIAALLLDLAGVPTPDIVHNYAISAHYLESQPKDVEAYAQFMAQIRRNPDLAKKLAGMSGTAPENMEIFIAQLHQQYGGAQSYLKEIGLSDVEIHALKVRLGQAG